MVRQEQGDTTSEVVVAYNIRGHCAISRKEAGSIPDEVNFFNLPNPSSRTRPWGLLSL
jgi:hypothetical protein